MWPGSGRLTVMLLAMQPSVLPQPTMPGDRLLVHAVLQRHDIAVRRQILPDQHGGPGGVVGFHADEGDFDRLLLGELLRVGDVERAHGHREFPNIHGVGDAQPVLPHVFDMLGPGIDERNVLARLRHMGTGIPADSARSDDRDLPAHDSPLHFLATADATAPAHPFRDTLADRSFPPTGCYVRKAGPCHAVNHGRLVIALVAVAQTTLGYSPPSGLRAVRVFGSDSAVDLIRIRIDPPLG
jgi:hypothetical protein